MNNEEGSRSSVSERWLSTTLVNEAFESEANVCVALGDMQIKTRRIAVHISVTSAVVEGSRNDDEPFRGDGVESRLTSCVRTPASSPLGFISSTGLHREQIFVAQSLMDRLESQSKITIAGGTPAGHSGTKLFSGSAVILDIKPGSLSRFILARA